MLPNLEKCLVLPSTFYNCPEIVALFDERFTVYCRDPKSFEYCKSLNKRATFKQHCDLAFTSSLDGLLPASFSSIAEVSGLQKAAEAVEKHFS